MRGKALAATVAFATSVLACVCSNAVLAEPVSCCEKPSYTDPYPKGRSTKVEEGRVATIDATTAVVTAFRRAGDGERCTVYSMPFNNDKDLTAPTVARLDQDNLKLATVYVNANFFDIEEGGNPYTTGCNTALGPIKAADPVTGKKYTRRYKNFAKVHGYNVQVIVFNPDKSISIVENTDSEAVKTALRAADAAVSGFEFVKDGAFFDNPGLVRLSPMSKMPRTAIGISADGKVLTVVVVNAGNNDSRGSSIHGLADYLITKGAKSGILLDGNGSSQMTYYNKSSLLYDSTMASDEALCKGVNTANGKCYRPVPIFLGFK